MIRINLLPFRAARTKENIRRQVSIFVLLLFFVIMVMVYENIILNSKIERFDSRVKSTRKQVDIYKKQAREVDKIKKKLTVLTQKMDTIDTLEVNRKEPVRILDAMTKMVIAKRMWFTSFDSKTNVIDIKGVALDNKTVADFMTRLEGSGLFTGVNLKTLKQKKEHKTSPLKSFEIICSKVSLKKEGVNKAKK
ncbi:MAG: PilN domain-containing protein [Deltaproteobacteria bacterium]|nr:PilN domain-containing protein [Deltaproteobacteria bacterium]